MPACTHGPTWPGLSLQPVCPDCWHASLNPPQRPNLSHTTLPSSLSAAPLLTSTSPSLPSHAPTPLAALQRPLSCNTGSATTKYWCHRWTSFFPLPHYLGPYYKDQTGLVTTPRNGFVQNKIINFHMTSDEDEIYFKGR